MIRFLLAEEHWKFYCNPTYHFSEYHSCLVHFQFTTTNNSSYLHKWAFQSNCMVPGVLRLIKIVLLKTTLYIFLNYYFLYLNEMFEINYLLTYLLPYLLTYLSKLESLQPKVWSVNQDYSRLHTQWNLQNLQIWLLWRDRLSHRARNW